MRFVQPQFLWLLAITLPLLGLFVWLGARKRRVLMQRFIQTGLLPQLTLGFSAARARLRIALILAAVTLIFLTLARPQWGLAWEEVRQRGLDIVVAIDTSRSMLATDAAPNRLTRARLAALDLVRLARTDRIGLVAFAGTAFIQCPLTLDDHAFQESVQALDTSIIPQGGTALSGAIRAALDAFKDTDDSFKALVLLTDGEDHDPGAVDAAKAAAEKGVRIFTIGVGTPNGELLRVQGPQGSDWIRDDGGDVVKSRLNEPLLKQVAETAAGFYLPLQGANTIDLLYDRGLAPLPKAEYQSRLVQRYHERFQWPLALATLLLLIEIILPDSPGAWRFRRPQPSKAAGSAAQSPIATVGVAVAALAAFPLQAASNSKAQQLYQQGHFEEARRHYDDLLQKHPDDPRLHYNAGTSAYRAGDFEEASRHFRSAVRSQDLPLQQRALYNLGNARFRAGEATQDAKEKQAAWEQAIQNYEAALQLRPEDADATYNRDFAQKRLEELKQQNQEQQDKNPQQDQKSDQDSKEDASKKSSQQSQDNSQNPKDPNQDSQQQNKDNASDPKSSQPNNPRDPSEANQPEPSKPGQKPGDKDPKDAGKPDPGSQAQSEPKDGQTGDPSQGASGAAASLGRMTLQQAQQLLEAHRGEERAMIFSPQDRDPKKAKPLRFKDW